MFQNAPLIILTGPTAVGKTDLSIKLAQKINGEIISADSMQVYKGMDIGSAKIKPKEMQGIKHYLIDVLEPTEEFNVTVFQEMANNAIHEILRNGKIPIITGGTGFYIQSVLYQIDFKDNDDNHKIRQELENFAKENGSEALHLRLKEVDPDAANQIHHNNVKRVIRALEFYLLTGEKISAHNETEAKKESPFHFAYFVLNNDRETLYERINRRVDMMFDEGLIDEVKSLMNHGLKRNDIAMQGLGYKEIADYLNGECTLEEARYIIKRDTRHFAKRQITWFKREKDVIWLNKNEKNDTEILEEIIEHLVKHKIIGGSFHEPDLS